MNVAGDDFGDLGGTSDNLTSPSIELRLGGMIKVLESDMGQLNVLIRAGYMVTGLYNDDFIGAESEFNPKIVSGAIGVNYLFDLGGL